MTYTIKTKDTRMTQAEFDTKEKVIELGLALDAARARGDEEEATRIIRSIPLSPRQALTMKEMWGKDGVLAAGYNLIEAERAYGENWLDK